MKRRICLLVFFLLVFAVTLAAGNITRGDVALVPDEMLVTIMNPDGIQGKDFFFNFGDTAKIDYPGIVIVFGTGKGKVLVFYKRTQESRGITCPNGGYFFLDTKTFLEWKAGKAAKTQKEKRLLKNLVRKIRTG